MNPITVAYGWLAGAIASEVLGTAFLQKSAQFTRLVPTVVMAAFYAASFYFLSQALRSLPLGIASIVYAAQVNGKYQSGDLTGAEESSRKAKKFAIWSAVAGIVLGVLYLLLVIALSAGSD